MARTELPNGVILPAEYSDDWYEDMTSNLTKLDDVIGSDSEKLNADGVDFLRMSSAALTDGGTGNFSDLNSSYKIKTGDLILDSGRKLYQVVSVDSTNERFTVGNSLFKVTAESDLAPVAESGDYDDLDNKPDLNPYDQHIADTDIHVTTADKTKWNNGVSQSYVFRYSSTAITDNSTIAYSTIDNTDNIKSGDKILDVDGKLFEITAVDTTNQTVTVGSALVDLALDANVVHTSGNETISGDKTWSGLNTFQQNVTYQRTNFYHQVVNPSYILKDTELEKGSLATTHASYPGLWQDKNGNNLGYVRFVEYSSGRQTAEFKVSNLIKNGALDPTGSEVDCTVLLELQPSGEKSLIPEQNNDINLGTATNKWKTFNGLTPSSLGMPDIANKIDISGYVSDLTGVGNEYTPPVNGWICVRSGNANKISILDSGTNIGNTSVSNTATYLTLMTPCVANRKVFINIMCTSLDFAYFIPCLGNI